MKTAVGESCAPRILRGLFVATCVVAGGAAALLFWTALAAQLLAPVAVVLGRI